MKINKSDLKQIIKEEATRFFKVQNLKGRKEKLEEAIQILSEGGELSEEQINELFGKFGAGLKSVGKMIGGKAKEVAGQAGQAIQKGAEKVGQAVEKGASDVKQAYKTGVDAKKMEDAKKQMVDIAQKISGLNKKYKLDKQTLQKQYANLTGGKVFKGAVSKNDVPVLAEGK